MIQIFKALSSLAMITMLTACGARDGDGTTPDLDQFKGLSAEPELIADTLVDGDPLYLNHEYAGSMMRTPSVYDNEHQFSFSAAETGLIVMELKGESILVDLLVFIDSDEVEMKLLGVGDGYALLVLEAEAGVTYSVEASLYLEEADVPYSYSLIVAEANRETLGLEENEYWFGVNIVQTEVCESTNVHMDGIHGNNFSLGFILNIPELYIRSGEIKYNLIKTSSNNYKYQIDIFDEFGNWSSASQLIRLYEVNFDSGVVVVDVVYSNEVISTYNTMCNGVETWNGKVLL